MLCPEVSNFPPPKVYCSLKENENVETAIKAIAMNNFYKSVIITCPDEHDTNFVQETLAEDSDYYKLTNCSLIQFIDRNFIEYFVKRGKLSCLTANRNCVIQNCAAITRDGMLIIHVLEFIYQTLGLEGTKRPYGYYEINIDLINLKHFEKTKKALAKLDVFDFYISWEPNDEAVCPSSIAKYFCERNIQVSVHSITFQKVTPQINRIPTLVDTDVDEIVEWMGMLAHEADVSPAENYISTYSEPECESPIQSTRISIVIAKGFLIPTILIKLFKTLTTYVESRELDNYWAAMSIQGNEESLWQFKTGTPKMFQSHNSSCSIFVMQNKCTIYSIGQLKYS